MFQKEVGVEFTASRGKRVGERRGEEGKKLGYFPLEGKLIRGGYLHNIAH
jgi:hypothetical protein